MSPFVLWQMWRDWQSHPVSPARVRYSAVLLLNSLTPRRSRLPSCCLRSCPSTGADQPRLHLQRSQHAPRILNRLGWVSDPFSAPPQATSARLLRRLSLTPTLRPQDTLAFSSNGLHLKELLLELAVLECSSIPSSRTAARRRNVSRISRWFFRFSS